MGEIADDIAEGLQCSWCGVCFEREHGYPVACESCWAEATTDRSGKHKIVQGYGGLIDDKSGVQPATEREL